MDAFILSPAFISSSEALTSLPLCEVRLQRDARWPWLVLIPRQAAAREIEDLSVADRGLLIEEITAAGAAVRAMGLALGWAVEKLNVGALGNITPQLHVHVVGRRVGDPAWPGPVWGVGHAVAYEPQALARARTAALAALNAG